jgi:hypothetical protein
LQNLWITAVNEGEPYAKRDILTLERMGHFNFALTGECLKTLYF